MSVGFNSIYARSKIGHFSLLFIINISMLKYFQINFNHWQTFSVWYCNSPSCQVYDLCSYLHDYFVQKFTFCFNIIENGTSIGKWEPKEIQSLSVKSVPSLLKVFYAKQNCILTKNKLNCKTLGWKLEIQTLWYVNLD